MQEIRPDLNAVVSLFKSALPDYDYVLWQLESKKKWLRFSPRLFQLTKNLHCDDYPVLFQSETYIQNVFLRAIFPNDADIRIALAELAEMSAEEQCEFYNESIRLIDQLDNAVEAHFPHLDALDLSPEAIALAEDEWKQLSEDEQKIFMRFAQHFLAFCLASFFNYFALMVHGRKLTQLVSEAMAGDDEAFCLAAHIEKSIIYHIPYFKERYQSALRNGEQDFLETVGRRLAQPHLNGRIRHRRLFMLFALLEGTYWLDSLKHREILDICDELQLDHYENRIETENALAKRLHDYREFQQSN